MLDASGGRKTLQFQTMQYLSAIQTIRQKTFIIISFPRAITQHVQYSDAGKDISPTQLYTVSAGNVSN